MKKAGFFAFFLIIAISSYAIDIDIPNRSVFIEGSSAIPEHLAFFNQNFRMEASAMGYTIVENREEAGFVFRFNVQNYTDDYDPRIRFIIMISLVFNESNTEMVSFGHPYRTLDDMYEVNQFLFYRAAVLIPPVGDEIINTLVEAASAGVPADNRWQNQILYLRLSVDYPIIAYELLPGTSPNLLFGGDAIYAEPPDGNNSRIHSIYWGTPGITLGLEIHPFRFLAVEINLQGTFGNGMSDDLYLAAGLEIKYNIKLRNAMIQPYITATVPLNSFINPLLDFIPSLTGDGPGWDSSQTGGPFPSPDDFKEFPMFFVGGGVQLGINGGGKNVIFININATFAFTEVIRHNNINPMYPNPPLIHYNRFSIGLGIGYRFGFINRP